VSLKIIKELVGYFKGIKKSQCEPKISAYTRYYRHFTLLLLYTNLRKQWRPQNYQFTHNTPCFHHKTRCQRRQYAMEYEILQAFIMKYNYSNFTNVKVTKIVNFKEGITKCSNELYNILARHVSTTNIYLCI